jgi:hypothetical protein
MKESSSAAPDHFAWFAGGTLAVGLLGFGTTALAAAHPAARSAAWLGVGAAEFSGLLGLSLKRWARARSLHAVFAVVGIVFGLRLLLVALGIALLRFRDANTTAFVIGFFAVYFVLQWLEIGYVSGASKAPRRI